MTTDGTPITVTIKTAKALSGLGNTKIWQEIKAGRLKTVSVGRRRLVLYHSLLELLGACPGSVTNAKRRDQPSKRA